MQSKKSKKTGSERRKHENHVRGGARPPASGKPGRGQNTPHRSPQKGRTEPAGALRAGANSYLLWGQHAVEAALHNPHRRIKQIYVTSESAQRLAEMTDALPADRASALPAPQMADKARFDKLTSDGGKALHQQLVLDVAPLEPLDLTDYLYQDGPLRCLVLDQVTDPRNIGAMLRSARAFGVSALVMTRRHAPDEGGVLARAAAGALEDVPIIQVTNLARALEAMDEAGLHIAGLEASGTTSLESLASQPRLALIMGSEGDGMRRLTREACHSLASIDMADNSESLNVSVAAAIALYASRLQSA